MEQLVVEVEKVARVATRVATKAVVVTKEVEAVDSREVGVEMGHQVPSLQACSITPHIHLKIGKEQLKTFSVEASLHRNMNEN